MFQMIETHRQEFTTDAVLQKVPGARPDGKRVFRDKDARITVVQHYYHRGGCLYGTGTVDVINLNNGETFTYRTTTGPIDADAAANMAWYRRREIGYIES